MRNLRSAQERRQHHTMPPRWAVLRRTARNRIHLRARGASRRSARRRIPWDWGLPVAVPEWCLMDKRLTGKPLSQARRLAQRCFQGRDPNGATRF